MFQVARNGIKIPVVGFGTWQLKAGQEASTAVTSALNCGYRLVDTASAYRNEESVGEAIRAWLKNPENKDQRVFVTSKANTAEMGYENVYAAAKRSLEKLGLPSLDLYLLHWPGCSKFTPNQAEDLRKMRIESWKAMERLYKEGLARCIGVSNYMVSHLDQLLEDGAEECPHVNQLEFHPACQVQDVRDWCKEHHTLVQAYSPLGVGAYLKDASLAEKSREAGCTSAQLLLRWAVDQGVLVLTRSRSAEHINENFQIDDVKVTPEISDWINRIYGKQVHRYCWDPTTVL